MAISHQECALAFYVCISNQIKSNVDLKFNCICLPHISIFLRRNFIIILFEMNFIHLQLRFQIAFQVRMKTVRYAAYATHNLIGKSLR